MDKEATIRGGNLIAHNLSMADLRDLYDFALTNK